jgi:two-component system, NarL family, sensor kinase
MTSQTRDPVATTPPAPWVLLTDEGAPRPARRQPPSTRRVVGQFIGASLLAAIVLLIVSVVVSRQAAKDEAISDARRTADVLAEGVIAPNVSDSLLRGDPAAVARLDRVVKGPIDGTSIVRVKIWTGAGKIVYSDEPRLIGSQYNLSEDDAAVLRTGATEAEISDLSRPENRFERSQGRLLEVYRPIHTPSGTPLLFETYSRYTAVTSRSSDIWRKFAPITIGVLLLLQLVQLPLAWRMTRQIRDAQRDREALLQRAVDASDQERRRIAGALHDGVVQDVAGASFVLAGAIDQLQPTRVDTKSRSQAVDGLRRALVAIRESIGGLRSMLVEIYPPSLHSSGLGTAIGDLISGMAARDIAVDCDVPDDIELPADVEGLVFRIVQESLRNISKHAQASAVRITLEQEPRAVTLTIADDGVGLDTAGLQDKARVGHFGLRVMTDLAANAGASLAVSSNAGAGTWLRLTVPLP